MNMVSILFQLGFELTLTKRFPFSLSRRRRLLSRPDREHRECGCQGGEIRQTRHSKNEAAAVRQSRVPVPAKHGEGRVQRVIRWLRTTICGDSGGK